jgi:hypothetical protein
MLLGNNRDDLVEVNLTIFPRRTHRMPLAIAHSFRSFGVYAFPPATLPLGQRFASPQTDVLKSASPI